MKTIFAIIAICFALITACMIYLIKSGTSIRSEGLIRPSVMTGDLRALTRSVLARLTPQFQNLEILVLDLDPSKPMGKSLLDALQSEHQILFRKKVNLILNATQSQTSEIANCDAPCWLVVPLGSAHQLSAGGFVNDRIKPLGRKYVTLSWIEFDRNLEVPPRCNDEKRVSFECIKPLSVHEAKRKMRDPNRNYFFMRKYLESDFFLFTEATVAN